MSWIEAPRWSCFAPARFFFLPAAFPNARRRCARRWYAFPEEHPHKLSRQWTESRGVPRSRQRGFAPLARGGDRCIAESALSHSSSLDRELEKACSLRAISCARENRDTS